MTFGVDTPSAQRWSAAAATKTNYIAIKKISSVQVTPRHKLAELGKELVRQSMSFSGPSHWTPMPAGQNDALVELHPNSDEYRQVLRHFRKTRGSDKMLKIERVQNMYLWRRYLARKMSMLQSNGGSGLHERVLFHGTRGTPPAKIWDGLGATGFDPRLGSGFYGVGAYVRTRSLDSIRSSSRHVRRSLSRSPCAISSPKRRNTPRADTRTMPEAVRSRSFLRPYSRASTRILERRRSTRSNERPISRPRIRGHRDCTTVSRADRTEAAACLSCTEATSRIRCIYILLNLKHTHTHTHTSHAASARHATQHGRVKIRIALA